MPKRNNLVKHPSDSVQGEGSYVVLRNITWGEMKRRGWISGKHKDGEDRTITEAEALFEFCIVEWNWVDDAGAALPLPSASPAVVDSLTYEETIFIMEKLFGSKVEIAKKKKL